MTNSTLRPWRRRIAEQAFHCRVRNADIGGILKSATIAFILFDLEHTSSISVRQELRHAVFEAAKFPP